MSKYQNDKYEKIKSIDWRIYAYLLNGKWGLTTDFEELTEPLYDNIKPIYGIYLKVAIGKKIGIIDRDGNSIIEPKYDDITMDVMTHTFIVKNNKYYGLYDKVYDKDYNNHYEEILPPNKYRELTILYGQKHPYILLGKIDQQKYDVLVQDDKKHETVFTLGNKNDIRIERIEISINQNIHIHLPFICIKTDTSIAIYNTYGLQITPYMYDLMSDIVDNYRKDCMCIQSLRHEWGYIDTMGFIIIPTKI